MGVAASVAALLAIMMLLLGLAANAASSTPQWPGPLNLIPQHPWWSTLIFLSAAAALTVWALLIGDGQPTPASSEELQSGVDGLHRHLDTLRVDPDYLDRTARLPPHPRTLLAAAGADQEHIWKVIAPFAEDAVVPSELAQEWARSLPGAIDALPAVGHVIVGELLLAYRQYDAALAQLRIAVDSAITPRAYWLIRMAQIHTKPDGPASADAAALVDEANKVDPNYPLVRAMTAVLAEDWDQVVHALDGWDPATFWEQELTVVCRHVALVHLDRLDDAILAIDSGPVDTSATLMLDLARLLRARAVRGTGDSGIADATRAVELAIRARNMKRLCRGDSAEAVLVAAEAAVAADDGPQTWRLTRPAPDGEATAAEAGDPRVLPLAAMGAVLTGRIDQGRSLISAAPDGYVRQRIEAELASADSSAAARDAAELAWRAALTAADTDEQRLEALRGLAMEGGRDDAALAELRPRYPGAVDDIDVLATIASISGPDADEQLRTLESRSPMATVRRAELLRHDDPEAAADVLIEAHTRWRHPRLLLLAMDCFQDAGRWEEADRVAQQVLAHTGAEWSGRATVLRRLADIQTARNDWAQVALTCRALLETDQHDEEARWILAHAQSRGGDPRDAWHTLQRTSVPPRVSTPDQARLLLELSRRYAPATEVARAALAMLHRFPDDMSVHGAAIGAVTTRVDRTDLPDDVGIQVQAAWESFLQRHPDDGTVRAFTIHDGDNPLAELDEHMRHRATSYHETLNRIRDLNHPLGMLSTVLGRPYAALFPFRPLGYHRMISPSPVDMQVELDLARRSLTGECLVDASALYTLALLRDVGPTLVAMLSRPATTDAAITDLVATEDMFSLPSDGTLTYDIESGRPVALPADPDTDARHRDQARTMLTTARRLRRLLHPALVHLRSLGPGLDPTWALTLDAAKKHGTALWADDTGLRAAAHSLRIATFSTHSLLTLAGQRDRIDADTYARITRTLLQEYIVDLPYEHDAVLRVAADQDWQPRSIATVLGRPATWSDLRRALSLFRVAFRHSPEAGLIGWAYAALTGIRDATIPAGRRDRLTAFTTTVLGDGWSQPQQVGAFVAALTMVQPDDVGTIVHTALDRLWARLRNDHPTDQAAIVFLHVISCLDEDYRRYGTRLILT